MATALGIHLCIYCAIAACLAYGLYALLQPARFANPGVAAYQAPPGIVVTYTLPLRLRNDRALWGAAAPMSPEPETTGLAAGRPEAEAFAQSTSPSELEAVAMPSKRPSKPRRDIQPVSAPQQRPACIPSYDSSGAQTGAC